VGDAAEIVRRREVLLAGELGGAVHVPQPELGLDAAVGLAGGAPGDEGLGIDGAPIRVARLHVGVGDLLDECGLVDRGEQAAALEICRDDLRDAARGFAIGRAAGEEIRQRDRDRLDVALVEIEAQHRLGRSDASDRADAGGGAEQDSAAARQQGRASSITEVAAAETAKLVVHGESILKLSNTFGPHARSLNRGTCRWDRI